MHELKLIAFIMSVVCFFNIQSHAQSKTYGAYGNYGSLNPTRDPYTGYTGAPAPPPPSPAASSPSSSSSIIDGTITAIKAIGAANFNPVPQGPHPMIPPPPNTPDNTTPDSTTPDSTTPDSTTPDNTTPDNTTPDNTTPDNTTPDNTIPVNLGPSPEELAKQQEEELQAKIERENKRVLDEYAADQARERREAVQADYDSRVAWVAANSTNTPSFDANLETADSPVMNTVVDQTASEGWRRPIETSEAAVTLVNQVKDGTLSPFDGAAPEMVEAGIRSIWRGDGLSGCVSAAVENGVDQVKPETVVIGTLDKVQTNLEWRTNPEYAIVTEYLKSIGTGVGTLGTGLVEAARRGGDAFNKYIFERAGGIGLNAVMEQNMNSTP